MWIQTQTGQWLNLDAVGTVIFDDVAEYLELTVQGVTYTWSGPPAVRVFAQLRPTVTGQGPGQGPEDPEG